MQRLLTIMMLSVAGLSLGCARYEYDVTRPTDLAAHIGQKDDTTLQRDPFEYRMRSVDNRLVIQIENTTDDPMQLIGEQSSVVDPQGQSHPLRSQPMPPRSFIKLIVPPYRPVVRHDGATFGIGVGTHVGDRRVHPEGFDEIDRWEDEPRYLTVYEDDALYWNWDGEGEARLMLTFGRKEQAFAHEFVIRRVKAK